MKQIIISQRVEHARINLYKNYSHIDDKSLDKNIITRSISDYDLLRGKGYNENYLFLNETYPYLDKKTNNATKFFKNLNYDEIILKRAGGREFNTLNKKAIKRNISNPFADIILYTKERKIEIDGDKVIISIYQQNKTRRALFRYFKKQSHSKRISINLKTGNFISVVYDKSNNKKSTKIFRVNCFRKLRELINILLAEEEKNSYPKNIYPTIKSVFDNTIFVKEICKVLDIEFRPIFVKEKTLLKAKSTDVVFESTLSYWIAKKFIEKRNIKVPNDFITILFNYYPGEKYLKKNKRKLFQSVLDSYFINSKITNKILHKNPRISLDFLATLCYIFGNEYTKYIGMISDKWFLLQNRPLDNHTNRTTTLTKKHTSNNWKLKTTDKEDILKLINNIEKTTTFDKLYDIHFINLLIDHVEMLIKIREYDNTIRITAQDYKEFNDEHVEFSTIISKIKKGWTIEYQFNQDMLDEVEKPIEIELDLGKEHNPRIVKEYFHPTLLKREEDYIEEGNFMHHCVASYSDKDTSVIISLRINDGNERVTCEFNCSTGDCLQARHFCNAQPPGDFIIALSELRNRVKYYAKRGMLHAIGKKRVPIKINGIEISPPKLEVELNQNLFPY